MGDRVPTGDGRRPAQARTRLIAGALAVGLLACSPAPPDLGDQTIVEFTPPPGSEPIDPGTTPSVTSDATGTVVPSVVPDLHYRAIGLSPLYSRFFGDEDVLRALAPRLGVVLPVSSLALEVSWDDEDKSGAITLYVPETDRRGEALADALASKAAVPAQDLSPLLQPLGQYREELAARYDLRILSFDIRLAFWDRRTGSHCSIGGAVGDPEGTQLGPCFRCLDVREGGRVQLCRDGEAWPATVTGSKKMLRRLENTLRSQPL